MYIELIGERVTGYGNWVIEHNLWVAEYIVITAIPKAA